GPYVVAVPTQLTPELEAEGLAREFIRRIQELRKQSGFDIADRIVVQYRASDRLAKAVAANAEVVAAEVLAVRLEEDSRPGGESTAEAEFDGETATVGLRRASAG
ncbi:MAG TPA: DUF5915 domain-containing protein, partial [bacterium]|nr:DUF5915 domain-containing protein [bacterium]